MIISGHMNFFSINECGLYKNSDPHPHGCEVTETFNLIADWAKGKPLSATLPWDPLSSRSGSAKCYLRDIHRDDENGDFLLVLWKSDADNVGTLWGAHENANTGKDAVVKYTNNYRGKKVVWGRPCYYWIVPDLNVIVSIKYEHSVCDSQLMQDWVSACITNRVQHSNKKKETTEGGFIRLSFTDDVTKQDARFRYGFDVALKTLSTSEGELTELAARVTHIVKRETINIETNDDRAEWLKKFNELMFINAKPKSKQRQIEIRAQAKPTAAEVKAIIESHAKENRRQSDWENVGFETEDGGTTWVDRYRLKSHINIDHDMNGIIAASTLYVQIAKNRDKYLAPITKTSSPSHSLLKTGTY